MIEDLSETYILCSTPYYLVKEFKKHAEVQRIGMEFSTQEISVEISTRIQNLQSPQDLIAIYALIVAMSLKSYSEIKDALQKAARSSVDWIPLVVGYVLDSVPQVSSVTVRPSQATSRPTETFTSANDNTFQFTVERDWTRKGD